MVDATCREEEDLSKSSPVAPRQESRVKFDTDSRIAPTNNATRLSAFLSRSDRAIINERLHPAGSNRPLITSVCTYMQRTIIVYYFVRICKRVFRENRTITQIRGKSSARHPSGGMKTHRVKAGNRGSLRSTSSPSGFRRVLGSRRKVRVSDFKIPHNIGVFCSSSPRQRRDEMSQFRRTPPSPKGRSDKNEPSIATPAPCRFRTVRLRNRIPDRAISMTSLCFADQRSSRPSSPVPAGRGCVPQEFLLRPKGSVVRFFDLKSMNSRPAGPEVCLQGRKGPGWKNGWTVGPCERPCAPANFEKPNARPLIHTLFTGRRGIVPFRGQIDVKSGNESPRRTRRARRWNSTILPIA